MTTSQQPEIHTPTSVGGMRQDYVERLPAILQIPITLVTGKAAIGQQAPRAVPVELSVAWSFLEGPLVVATTATLVSFSHVFLLLLPVSWAMTVGALRKLQVYVGHHAVHGEFPWGAGKDDDTDASRRANRFDYWLQTFASAICLVQRFEDYKLDHDLHHSRKAFTTEIDPDAAFLQKLGFRLHTSTRRLWTRLWMTPFSPYFHGVFFLLRLRTNFVTATWDRRVVAAAWLAVLALVSTLMPWWLFLFTVVVPLGPLYQVSALLQFLTEHAWLRTDGPASTQEVAERTWGRFCIVPLPRQDLTVLTALGAWTLWTGRVLVQVLVRTSVLVGDLPAHDYHHLVQHDHEWRSAFFSRQASIDGGRCCPRHAAGSEDPHGFGRREFHRLRDVIDVVFAGISRSSAS